MGGRGRWDARLKSGGKSQFLTHILKPLGAWKEDGNFKTRVAATVPPSESTTLLTKHPNMEHQSILFASPPDCKKGWICQDRESMLLFPFTNLMCFQQAGHIYFFVFYVFLYHKIKFNCRKTLCYGKKKTCASNSTIYCGSVPAVLQALAIHQQTSHDRPEPFILSHSLLFPKGFVIQFD